MGNFGPASSVNRDDTGQYGEHKTYRHRVAGPKREATVRLIASRAADGRELTNDRKRE